SDRSASGSFYDLLHAGAQLDPDHCAVRHDRVDPLGEALRPLDLQAPELGEGDVDAAVELGDAIAVDVTGGLEHASADERLEPPDRRHRAAQAPGDQRPRGEERAGGAAVGLVQEALPGEALGPRAEV